MFSEISTAWYVMLVIPMPKFPPFVWVLVPTIETVADPELSVAVGSSHVIGPDEGDPGWVVDDILLGQFTTGGSSSKNEQSSKKGEFSPFVHLMQNIFQTVKNRGKKWYEKSLSK